VRTLRDLRADGWGTGELRTWGPRLKRGGTGETLKFKETRKVGETGGTRGAIGLETGGT